MQDVIVVGTLNQFYDVVVSVSVNDFVPFH